MIWILKYDDLLLKLIGEINNDENPFGKKVGEQTK